MALHTESTAVADFARGQQFAATRLSSTAASARSDVSSLVGTFGLIGADFLAAVAYVVGNHANRMESSAARYQSLSTTSTEANQRYTSTDDTAKRGLEVRV
ncbi:type VII secretion target [Gordonia sp. CPCC 205333]|uniref:type VII secretion target n=1 Tax=Gordonia sp. CPCC 205333 TaxID=3140790 RepID=UPI003AF403D6